MYDDDSVKLRQRTTRSDSGISAWQSGKGDFFNYQMKFRDKYPGTFFENESADPATRSIECSITGFEGTARELLKNETPHVKFYVQDGRIVVRYFPKTQVPKLKPKHSLLLLWMGALVMLCAFVVFNSERYRNIL